MPGGDAYILIAFLVQNAGFAGARAAPVALTCLLLILLFGLNRQLHNGALSSPCFKCTYYSLPCKTMPGPSVCSQSWAESAFLSL